MTTVLIVDDHATFRASAKALLSAEGYDVIGEAEDGENALGEIERLRPDVVLLDVLLPDTTGFELAEELCNGPEGPVVVLTSSRSAADFGGSVERSRAHGFIAKRDLSALALARVLEGAA